MSGFPYFFITTRTFLHLYIYLFLPGFILEADMILYFIIAMVIIYMVIEFPSTIIMAAIILLAAHLSKNKWKIVTADESAEDSAAEEKDGNFETTEEKQERNMKDAFIPGFKDDKIWQERVKELHTTRTLARAMADDELKLDMLKEAEEHALAGRWNKVHELQDAVAQMEANSSKGVSIG